MDCDVDFRGFRRSIYSACGVLEALCKACQPDQSEERRREACESVGVIVESYGAQSLDEGNTVQ